ncbi:MAG: hypothetical protein AB1467_04070 [Candidatus Diapherotrites archaeon]
MKGKRPIPRKAPSLMRSFGLMARGAPTPSAVIEAERLLRGGARISKDGRLVLSKKQLEYIEAKNKPKPPKAKREFRLERKILSKGRRELIERIKVYGYLLKSRRTKALIYSIERKGLGSEFTKLLKLVKKEELTKLISIKNTGKPFLDLLKTAGGERAGRFVNVVGVGRAGEFVFNVGGERAGNFVNVVGVGRAGKALEKYGVRVIVDKLAKDFDDTVKKIKKTGKI